MKKLILISCLLMIGIANAAMPDANDFAKLRFEYAALPQVELHWANNHERKKLLELYQSNKKKFAQEAAKWLEKCPVDARIHMLMGNALSDSGRLAESAKYRYYYYGLMQSIITEREGTSKTSAFKIISIDEEYTLLNYLNAKVLKQRSQNIYDIFEVEINNKKKEIYFDAALPLRELQASLKDRIDSNSPKESTEQSGIYLR